MIFWVFCNYIHITFVLISNLENYKEACEDNVKRDVFAET